MADNDIATDVQMDNRRSSSPEGGPQVVTYPTVPRSFKERTEWMKTKARHTISRFAVESKKVGKVPDLSNPKISKLLEESEIFLNFLEYAPSFVMTPEIKTASSIQPIFDLILCKPEYHFPDHFKARAQRILDSWIASNWGAGDEEVSDESDEEELEATAADAVITTPAASTSTTSAATEARVSILPPPRRHPIWGVDGIMHGVARKVRPGGRFTCVLDRRYRKTPSNRYGDNGLEPGDWFPYQLVALFNGAHGSRQAGIHGDHQHGAYSIVVAGKYHGLDRDEGDTIYYSGAGSDENTDPTKVKAGQHDATLAASIRSQKPVRVLRAAVKDGRWAPSVGIRYDGLYRVVRQETNLRNSKGGLFTRYVLERLPGQPDMRQLARISPTRKQLSDYNKIKEVYY